MQHDDSTEDLRYGRYRTLDGSEEKASLARRGGKLILSVAPGAHEPTLDDPRPPAWEDDGRYYVNLNETERRTWRMILQGRNESEIARAENVSPQAIRARIQGNSRGQGGMIRKNFWVLLWWLAKSGTRPLRERKIPT